MSIEKIHQLLTDESRPGAPEPTLLPWLTRRIAPSGLSVAAAAGAGILSARDRWPVLADIRSLRWLAVARLVDIGTETDQQAVYLLPSRSGPRAHWQAMEAIEAAVRTDRHWYTAALLARAAPYLG